MAEEPRYPDEIRIPISITLPWSGRFTSNGHPWPIDVKGRPWPEHNGEPEFPIDLLPKGIAPGTGHLPPPEDRRSLPELFAAMDGAMQAELAEARRRAARRPIQTVADRTPAGPPATAAPASDAAPSAAADPAPAAVPAAAGPEPAPTPPPPPAGPMMAAEPEHGAVWWWLHAHGLAETRHEQADDLRRFIKASGGLVSGFKTPIDVDTMPDDELLALDKQMRQPSSLVPIVPGAIRPLKSKWGWNGAKPYKDILEQLRQPGTHETLNGQVPTREEAVRMIEESGGTVERIEEGHPETPTSKSTHREPHINYNTAPRGKALKREKATVYVQPWK